MDAVGARIRVDGHHGTVKFIGEVPPTEGEWLGVDWDNPKRGKHDGSKDSVRYFTTSHPTSGSFIRRKKAEFGQDIMTAVKERYGAIDDENAGVIVEDMYVCGNNQRTTVEVVGAKSVNLHQSQLNHLHEIAVRGMPISRAGPDGAVHSSIPAVKILDVSDTLLSSWSEIARITKQLPQLEILYVSDNRLEYKDEPETAKDAFVKVKILTANRCKMTWDDVVKLSDILPSVETIHVCFNSITDLSLSADKFKNLKFLNLEGNKIEKWEYILQLSHLQSIETLILNNTGIDKIEFPDVSPGQTTQYFPKLKALSVFHNKINDWLSVNELNKLESFEDLKLRFNPLTQNTKLNEETIRSLMIAKIAGLKSQNRTLVLVEERSGAELDYLRMFGKEWRDSGGHQDPTKNKPSQEFTLNHPRYQSCIDAHGACEDTEFVVKTSALKNNLITVTINCPLRPEKPPFQKKLPVGMSLQKLKALFLRLYKGDPITMRLSYSSTKNPHQEYEMDNDMRELSYFALEDGDCIYVRW